MGVLGLAAIMGSAKERFEPLVPTPVAELSNIVASLVHRDRSHGSESGVMGD